ncbi:hypothetical protein HMPREF0091_11041 [Fannyhessea vaginae DSM 15829]|uniref:Uncharacterized protein n=1 Tax=Fannyhessea vaginae DSM 15829 TaxID=525256 RepID=F1T6E1_9ACTN|nr:hypothetical protein HMPREF0091_11041 [Fannyhessea vaginae DSM 15829]
MCLHGGFLCKERLVSAISACVRRHGINYALYALLRFYPAITWKSHT